MSEINTGAGAWFNTDSRASTQNVFGMRPVIQKSHSGGMKVCDYAMIINTRMFCQDRLVEHDVGGFRLVGSDQTGTAGTKIPT